MMNVDTTYENKLKLSVNSEAETGILGSLLLYPNSVSKILDMVREDDFYNPNNKIIFSIIKKIYDRNEAIDYAIIIDELNKENRFNTNGLTIEYLYGLTNYSSSESYVESYINSVLDASLRRNTIDKIANLLSESNNPNISTDQLIDNLESISLGLSKSRNVDSLKEIRTVTSEVVELVETRSKNSSTVIGLDTGLKGLDKYTYGFQPTQLIILAARPGVGKSALATSIALNVAKKNKSGRATVAFFSLEMPATQLVERLIANQGRLELDKIKKGTIPDNEWTRFTSACNTLSGLNIYFDDSTNITVSKLRAKCRKLLTEKGLDFVIIDYLQLINGDTPGKSTQEEVSKISRGLKLMAMELGIPVLALSQLSRAVDKREDKRPILSDLRDSGTIEQDADMIMFIYRDDREIKENRNSGEAQLLLSKNRHGATNTDGIPMLFTGKYSCFEDGEIN